LRPGKQATDAAAYGHAIPLGLLAEAPNPVPVDEPLFFFALDETRIILGLDSKNTVGTDKQMVDVALIARQDEIVEHDVIVGQGF